MAWLGLAAIAVVVILSVWFVATAPTVGDNSMVGRATIAALPVAVVLALGGALRRWVRTPGPVPPQQSQRAADHLADETLTRWEQEARLRGITGSGQLPVAWRWAASDVTIPAADMNPPHTGPTRGLVTDLLPFYRALSPNWNRLVILGSPGSGKTAAMTLLLLNLLKERRPDEPVPVWVTLGGWNPTEQTLRDYAANVIGRDFPSTRAQVAGGNAGPAALLAARQVALFLDGMDEMPDNLRAQAARVIDQERTLAIVMTSRAPEYASATTRVAFYGAVIEMIPLTIEQTIRALKTGHKADRTAAWEAFTDRLAHESSGTALWTSPLIVSLLRQTYETSGDACELLDSVTFPTDNAIRAALIERVLDQAYPVQNARDDATYWLTWLADNLKGTRDIRWWDIPRWTPHLRLSLGVSGGLMIGLGFGLGFGLVVSAAGGLVVGLIVGLVGGFGSGLTGLEYPKSLGIRPPSPRDLVSGLAGGLVVGLVSGLVFGLVFGLVEGLKDGLVVGLGFGLLAWLGALLLSLHAWLGQPIAGLTATPSLIYRLDVRFGLVGGLMGGLMVGLVFGLVFATVGEPMSGIADELVGGIVVGLGAGLGLGPLTRPSWAVFFSGLILGARARRPFRPLRVLETARDRQILRQVGSVYQFRHAELQDHLAPRPTAAAKSA